MIVKLNATETSQARYINLANATIMIVAESGMVTLYWNYLQPAVDGESTVDYERFYGSQAQQLIGALDRLAV